MFPITDTKGRVIAFGGRALDPDAPAKYLNSPETPLFHKGAVLFNAHNARGPAHDKSQIIVVEGYMDVIALSRSGLSADRRAARHGPDRGPAQAALAHGARADPVLRRRCGRTPGGLPGGRDRAAASAARLQRPVRVPARRARSRRSRAPARRRAPSKSILDNQDAAAVRRPDRARGARRISRPSRPSSGRPWRRGSRRLVAPHRRSRRARSVRAGAAADAVGEEPQARPRADPQRRASARRNSPASAATTPSSTGACASGPTSGPGSAHPPRAALAATALARSNELSERTVSAPPREALLVLTLINHPWLLEQQCEEVAELTLTSAPLVRLRDALLELLSDGNPLDSASVRSHLSDIGLGQRDCRGRAGDYAQERQVRGRPMQRPATWKPAGGTLWRCTRPRLACRWRCRPQNGPGARTRARRPGHASWSCRTGWRGGAKRRIPVRTDTGPRSIERPGRRRPRHDCVIGKPWTGVPDGQALGITGPALSLMQQRNTGKAHTGCVCLLRAPDEGITSRRAQPSRFGNVGPHCAVPGVAGSAAARGRFLWNAWSAAIDVACTSFADLHDDL